VVKHRIRIGFTKAGDPLVLCKHGGKALLQALAWSNSEAKGRDATVLFIVKQWHFSFAAPAPEHFHRPVAHPIVRHGFSFVSDTTLWVPHSACLSRGACVERGRIVSSSASPDYELKITQLKYRRKRRRRQVESPRILECCKHPRLRTA
jgi:hypothetical protein